MTCRRERRRPRRGCRRRRRGRRRAAVGGRCCCGGRRRLQLRRRGGARTAVLPLRRRCCRRDARLPLRAARRRCGRPRRSPSTAASTFMLAPRRASWCRAQRCANRTSCGGRPPTQLLRRRRCVDVAVRPTAPGDWYGTVRFATAAATSSCYAYGGGAALPAGLAAAAGLVARANLPRNLAPADVAGAQRVSPSRAGHGRLRRRRRRRRHRWREMSALPGAAAARRRSRGGLRRIGRGGCAAGCRAPSTSPSPSEGRRRSSCPLPASTAPARSSATTRGTCSRQWCSRYRRSSLPPTGRSASAPSPSRSSFLRRRRRRSASGNARRDRQVAHRGSVVRRTIPCTTAARARRSPLIWRRVTFTFNAAGEYELCYSFGVSAAFANTTAPPFVHVPGVRLSVREVTSPLGRFVGSSDGLPPGIGLGDGDAAKWVDGTAATGR